MVFSPSLDAPEDLLFPADGRSTAHGVFALATRARFEALKRLPEPPGLGEAAALYRSARGALAQVQLEEPKALGRLMREPVVGTAFRRLWYREAPAPRAASELSAQALFELALARALPSPVTVDVEVPRLLSPARGVAGELPEGGTTVTFSAGRVVAAGRELPAGSSAASFRHVQDELVLSSYDPDPDDPIAPERGSCPATEARAEQLREALMLLADVVPPLREELRHHVRSVVLTPTERPAPPGALGALRVVEADVGSPDIDSHGAGGSDRAVAVLLAARLVAALSSSKVDALAELDPVCTEPGDIEPLRAQATRLGELMVLERSLDDGRAGIDGATLVSSRRAELRRGVAREEPALRAIATTAVGAGLARELSSAARGLGAVDAASARDPSRSHHETSGAERSDA
jgi:hypothetical protein